MVRRPNQVQPSPQASAPAPAAVARPVPAPSMVPSPARTVPSPTRVAPPMSAEPIPNRGVKAQPPLPGNDPEPLAQPPKFNRVPPTQIQTPRCRRARRPISLVRNRAHACRRRTCRKLSRIRAWRRRNRHASHRERRLRSGSPKHLRHRWRGRRRPHLRRFSVPSPRPRAARARRATRAARRAASTERGHARGISRQAAAIARLDRCWRLPRVRVSRAHVQIICAKRQRQQIDDDLLGTRRDAAGDPCVGSLATRGLDCPFSVCVRYE